MSHEKYISDLRDISERLHKWPSKRDEAIRLLTNNNLTQIQRDYLVTVIKCNGITNDYYVFKTILFPLIQIHEKYNGKIRELTQEVDQLTALCKEHEERVIELQKIND